MPRLVPLLLLFVAAGVAAAAEPAPASTALDRVKADIFFLAGEECEGRGLETDGIQKAARRIADTFAKAGLKPAGTDGYFQPFPVYTGKAARGETNSLTFTPGSGDAVKPKLDDGFVPLAGNGKVSGEVVFVGYGITAPKLKYDDYTGLDVAGKWVVILRRTPRADDKDKPFDPAADSPFSSLNFKLQQAEQQKVAGVIFVNDTTYGKGSDAPITAGTLPDTKLPVVQVKRAVLEKLMPKGKTLADVEAGIDADTQPNSFALTGWTADAEVSFVRPSVTCKNVVGVLEGAGPLADETIVVGAHYDHLGRGEGGRGASRDSSPAGKVHYGADDNASGTTGLLELARRMGAIKDRVGRRIVFIAFSGEERGLYGSKHYCEHPAFPLDKTAFMLNMDMIGRASPASDAEGEKAKKDRLVVYGTGTGNGLEAATDLFNARVGFNVIKVPTGSGPSDHESFFLKRVPVLFLFTGTHRDYHTPSDTPDKINLPGLVKAVDFAELLTAHFAAVLERPQFEATKGGWYDPTEAKPKKSAKSSGPRMGIMPGNYEAEDGGVLVDDVTPGGAAEAAGIKKGDRIVTIAGKPVKNINDYMTAMAAQKAGVEIAVQVVRKDKKETVKVTPK